MTCVTLELKPQEKGKSNMNSRKKSLMEDIHFNIIFKCIYIRRRLRDRELMKKKFVDELHWVEEKEMLDLVAIAQSSPGAIAINGAIVVGYKLAGIAGVLVSIIGTVIPPFVIIALLSVCYNAFRTNELVSQMLEGMQAGVGAVIASVTYEMGAGIVKEKDGISLLIMAGAFVASCVFEVNVVYIVIICGLLGVLRTCMSRKGAGK